MSYVFPKKHHRHHRRHCSVQGNLLCPAPQVKGGIVMCLDCCTCPEGVVMFLDRRVVVSTKCGEIRGILRAFGETFLEVEEDNPKLDLTVIQCGQICSIRLLG